MIRKRPRSCRRLVCLAAFVAAAPLASADSYRPKVGKPHPQIVLPTIEYDRTVALSQFRGKKVLLIHFASW